VNALKLRISFTLGVLGGEEGLTEQLHWSRTVSLNWVSLSTSYGVERVMRGWLRRVACLIPAHPGLRELLSPFLAVTSFDFPQMDVPWICGGEGVPETVDVMGTVSAVYKGRV